MSSSSSSSTPRRWSEVELRRFYNLLGTHGKDRLDLIHQNFTSTSPPRLFSLESGNEDSKSFPSFEDIRQLYESNKAFLNLKGVCSPDAFVAIMSDRVRSRKSTRTNEENEDRYRSQSIPVKSGKAAPPTEIRRTSDGNLASETEDKKNEAACASTTASSPPHEISNKKRKKRQNSGKRRSRSETPSRKYRKKNSKTPNSQASSSSVISSSSSARASPARRRKRQLFRESPQHGGSGASGNPGSSSSAVAASASRPEQKKLKSRRRLAIDCVGSINGRASSSSVTAAATASPMMILYQGYGPSVGERKSAMLRRIRRQRSLKKMQEKKGTGMSSFIGSSPILSPRTARLSVPSDPRVVQFINALSSELCHFLRCEWFYSGIDRDYFHPDKSEFVRELDALFGVRDGNSDASSSSGVVSASVASSNAASTSVASSAPRTPHALTRDEWSAIRSKMKRRRRFGRGFLANERKKLREYRRQVRKCQASAERAYFEDCEYDVPVPLFVGQRVSAIHKAKGHVLAIGSILTCDLEIGEYRVQFDRQELGVEICSDSDILCHGVPGLLVDSLERLRRPLPSSSSAALTTLSPTTNEVEDEELRRRLQKRLKILSAPTNALWSSSPRLENARRKRRRRHTLGCPLDLAEEEEEEAAAEAMRKEEARRVMQAAADAAAAASALAAKKAKSSTSQISEAGATGTGEIGETKEGASTRLMTDEDPEDQEEEEDDDDVEGKSHMEDVEKENVIHFEALDNLFASVKPHAVDADVRLFAGIRPVLERKRQLLRTLKMMDESSAHFFRQREEAGDGGTDDHGGEEEPGAEDAAKKKESGSPHSKAQLMKQQYAWILVNLEETNRVLDTAMAQFRARFGRQYRGGEGEKGNVGSVEGAGISSKTGNVGNGGATVEASAVAESSASSKGGSVTDAWLDSFEDMCSHTARVLTSHIAFAYRFGKSPPTPPGIGDGRRIAGDEEKECGNGGEVEDSADALRPHRRLSVAKVVENAVTLAVGLRSCAEDMVGLRATRVALSRVAEGLKPQCSTNFDMYGKVLNRLETIQGLLDATSVSSGSVRVSAP